MSILLPEEAVQVDFEQHILQGWHQAHGTDAGRICSSWGEDRVVVMIENVLFEGERLLSQSEEGKAVLAQYVQELMELVVTDQSQLLSELLGRQIVSTSVSMDMDERWVMFIFRWGE